MQVLQERVTQQVLVGGVADDSRDRLEPGLTSRAGTALAHDEFIGAIPHVTYDDGLQHPELANAVHQLGEVVLVEDRPRLPRVRNDHVRIDVDQPRAGHLDEVWCRLVGDDRLIGRGRGGSLEGRAGEEHIDRTRFGLLARWDEGADASTQACSLGHQEAPSFSGADAPPDVWGAASAASRWMISTAASRYATAPADAPS